MTAPAPASIITEGAVTRLVVGQPIMTTALLAQLTRLLTDLAPAPLVIASSHPRIFLAGAHLAEIAALDSRSSREYARRGRDLMSLVAEFPAPVVAAVHGSCSGGGFDLALSCDAVVAGPGASFAHPGVVRGLVTGWGGTLALRRRISPALAARVLLRAQPPPLSALTAAGLVRCVTSDPTRAAIAEAGRLADLHPVRLQLWRSFRVRRFVDSFRAFVVHNQ